MKKYLLIIISLIVLMFILAGCKSVGDVKFGTSGELLDKSSSKLLDKIASSEWKLACDDASGNWCNCKNNDECSSTGFCVFRDTGNPNLGKMCAGPSITGCPQNVNNLGQGLISVYKEISGEDHVYICDGLKNPTPLNLQEDIIVAKNGKTCKTHWWYMEGDEKTISEHFNCKTLNEKNPWCATDTTTPGDFYVSGRKYGTNWAYCDPTQKDIVKSLPKPSDKSSGTSEKDGLTNSRKGSSGRLDTSKSEPIDNYKWSLTCDPNADTNDYCTCKENSDCDSSVCVVRDSNHPEVGKMCAGTCTYGCPKNVNSLGQDLNCKEILSGSDNAFYCIDLA
ncbi:hypothetical protein HQ489_03750 [Candidatus Woesearchaeota archaeon]|nr:hypothetical protein [Candidatus Woesearchaeota archaeon]